tara:strand:+ start:391 stop:528 length:138 start_codon:yes stop_codon:yes gene_type:complete
MMEWNDMDIENGLKDEGRSDDFIAGAKWSWETTMKAMQMYYSMKR